MTKEQKILSLKNKIKWLEDANKFVREPYYSLLITNLKAAKLSLEEGN